MQKLLAKTGWTAADVDLWEINEAFAVVTMAAIPRHAVAGRKSEYPWRRLCAGSTRSVLPEHGSSSRCWHGALKKYGLKRGRGRASLCIGGGEATALAVEML
jgi:acetyl-CoA C-acetyltransferase